MAIALAASICAPARAFAADPAPSSNCERVVVVPLEPAGLSPEDARAEEEKLRSVVAGSLSGVCVQPRADAVKVLKSLEGHRLPSCEDATCRAQLAESFGADWLLTGTAYGFGGGRTVTMTLWSRNGLAVQRGSYASGSAVDDADAPRAVVAMFHDARLGRSIADGSVQKGGRERVQRSHLPEIALGAAAVAALAGGAAFASASQSTADKVSRQQTGCPGQGSAYVTCVENTVRTGKGQATTANALFGASALLGIGAGVFFVVDLP